VAFIARLNREGHTVLLTTHYLEEAEALCGRIGMLARVSGGAGPHRQPAVGQRQHHAALQDRPGLAAALAAQARITGRIVQLKAKDAADVERLLAVLREAGVKIEDLEIGRADLEDVFLEIMHGGRPQAAPAQPQAVPA
jgi:ABC-2 type transport system ATP-binding protein